MRQVCCAVSYRSSNSGGRDCRNGGHLVYLKNKKYIYRCVCVCVCGLGGLLSEASLLCCVLPEL